MSALPKLEMALEKKGICVAKNINITAGKLKYKDYNKVIRTLLATTGSTVVIVLLEHRELKMLLESAAIAKTGKHPLKR